MGYLHHTGEGDRSSSTQSSDPMRHYQNDSPVVVVDTNHHPVCCKCGKVESWWTRDVEPHVCDSCEETAAIADMGPYQRAVHAKDYRAAWGLLPDPCGRRHWEYGTKKCQKPTLARYLSDMGGQTYDYLEV